MNYEIVEITSENQLFHNKSLEPFEVFGRLEVTFQNGKWRYEEVLFDKPYTKSYSGEMEDLESFIKSAHKTVFYAVTKSEAHETAESKVIGQIVIRSNWNQFCIIDDIAVRQCARKMGVASSLIDRAMTWAINNNLKGFMLETQDINLAACKLYLHNGFKIGAVDTMLYSNFETKDEQALIWYKRFVE